MFNEVFASAANEEAPGNYVCSSCRNVLFEATKKFDAGCGFPSFWEPAEDGIKQNPLHTYNRSRIQLLCARCGVHLGHLFGHKHKPSGLRYCINHDAIRFQPENVERTSTADTQIPARPGMKNKLNCFIASSGE